MLGEVAAFEFRYQVRSALFRVSALLIFLITFVDMSLVRLGTIGGGNVLSNAPHAIIVKHCLFSMVFLFLGAAFVSNVIVRDDQSGFGPIIRSTSITKGDYLFGRFIGAFAVAALILAAVPFGTWLGTLMPFADQSLLGPNRLSGFLYGYFLFALPSALIISAVLFALATATRSTAGTFVGVIAIFVIYLVSQRLMEAQTQPLSFRVLADPLGMSAYMAASRYLTAAELNAGVVPVTTLMVESRLLWIGAALVLLAISYHLFGFSERRMSPRRQRRMARQAALEGPPGAAGQQLKIPRLPDPRFGARTSLAQFLARAAMEARFIFKSPVFLILLVIALSITLANLFSASSWMGVPAYPLASVAIPIINESFRTVLLIIATYYAGELVWREREYKLNEIIDSTPLPAWALMMPKLAGLAIVLIATLLAGMAAGLLVQWFNGGTPVAVGPFLRWYLLPGAADALLVAALAVFVSAMSPSKYAGWGVMFAYAAVLTFGPSLGLEYPLFIYGNVPDVALTEMTGAGNFAPAAWWFRLFWAAVALVLLIVAHLLWPRGAEARLSSQLRHVRSRLSGGTGIGLAGAVVLLLVSASWVAYNTLLLNPFQTSAHGEHYLADYEKRYFRYARLPQPAVRHVALNVALFPAEQRAEVRGRYELVNDTAVPIDRVHVRLMSPGLQLVSLDFPGALIERDDEQFAYRIYRLDAPMKPGEVRSLEFRTRRQQSGFRAGGIDSSISADATDLDTLALTPRIGMSDVGLLDDPAARRKFGLPEERPLPRLGDRAATGLVPSGDAGWVTADITVSTSADQVPVAAGRRVFDRIENGRRIARFVSDNPTKNLLPIQSARYAVTKQSDGGIEYEIYSDPAHRWNVDRMMTAMRGSIAYYAKAFGPYQYRQLRIVETAYDQGGHANPNSVTVGEDIFTMDLRDPAQLDMVTMLTAHEVAHQWWGHQVLGARMQGGSLLYETLAQYSALMVLKRLRGEADIRRYLAFQRDRYLSGRRTQVLAEEPLASVEISQQHIAYGKGALALYLLQDRIGESAVNRALRRFVDRYRFTTAPYPRSVDLIAMLRDEAKSPEDQALITDLFERITIYDLKVAEPVAVRRSDGKWDVSVPVEAKKLYADGRGAETEAPLADVIPIALFTADPRSAPLGKRSVVVLERRKVRSGRQLFRFVTNVRPAYAAIDPDGLYIDRNSLDNVAAVRARPTGQTKAPEAG